MMDFFDQEIQPQNELTYTLNLAGTKKKDIKIKHTQNTMYVETPENKYQLRIPANFNIESSKAKYEDGLLVVKIQGGYMTSETFCCMPPDFFTFVNLKLIFN
jgi:HSP20 family molecular chaperone IbpA